MKTLILIRHAKAEEHGFSKSDFFRDLQDKGRNRAARIALELHDLIPVDEKTLVISSTANRAIQTAEIFCQILGYPQAAIQQVENIYEAHFTEILKVINAVDDQYDKLLVFGHNPGLSNLVNYLSHSEVELATSNAAILTLEDGLNFSMLSGGTATLRQSLK